MYRQQEQDETNFLWNLVDPTCHCGKRATRRGCLLPDSDEPVCLCTYCYDNEGARGGTTIQIEEVSNANAKV